MYLFPIGGFDNGMRQVTLIPRPIANLADFAGIKIRVPAGQMIFDTFRGIRGPADQHSGQRHLRWAQERKGRRRGESARHPGRVRLYEAGQYVSMTNHMWSGFNLMAHLPTGKPSGRHQGRDRAQCRQNVRQQRDEQGALNASLRADFTKRGIVFNDVDQSLFRAKLPHVYTVWKEKLGSKCWALLEAEVGKLAEPQHSKATACPGPDRVMFGFRSQCDQPRKSIHQHVKAQSVGRDRNYDRARALFDGSVRIDGVDPVFMMLRRRKFSSAPSGLMISTFASCRCRASRSRPPSAMSPMSGAGLRVARVPPQLDLLRTDRIKSPADLKGKRSACRNTS